MKQGVTESFGTVNKLHTLHSLCKMLLKRSEVCCFSAIFL